MFCGSIGTVNNYSYFNLNISFMFLEVWVDLIHQLYFKLCEHCLIIKGFEKNKKILEFDLCRPVRTLQQGICKILLDMVIN